MERASVVGLQHGQLRGVGEQEHRPLWVPNAKPEHLRQRQESFECVNLKSCPHVSTALGLQRAVNIVTEQGCDGREAKDDSDFQVYRDW